MTGAAGGRERDQAIKARWTISRFGEMASLKVTGSPIAVFFPDRDRMVVYLWLGCRNDVFLSCRKAERHGYLDSEIGHKVGIPFQLVPQFIGLSIVKRCRLRVHLEYFYALFLLRKGNQRSLAYALIVVGNQKTCVQ